MPPEAPTTKDFFFIIIHAICDLNSLWQQSQIFGRRVIKIAVMLFAYE